MKIMIKSLYNAKMKVNMLQYKAVLAVIYKRVNSLMCKHTSVSFVMVKLIMRQESVMKEHII